MYPLSSASYGVDEVMYALEAMASYKTTMWSRTMEFEASFAAKFDARHAIMVNSGSSADLLIAFSLGDSRFA